MDYILAGAKAAFCSILFCSQLKHRNSLQLLLASSILRTLDRGNRHILLLALSRGLSACGRLVFDIRRPKSRTNARCHYLGSAGIGATAFRKNWTGRTCEEDGDDGNQVERHGDGTECGVGAPSLVNHFLLLLRVPALQLEVSPVVARSRLHA